MTIPYAAALAALVPPVAIRLRRDFGKVLNLVRAQALLHQATRERDAEGRIVATLEDYAAVRDLVGDLVRHFRNSGGERAGLVESPSGGLRLAEPLGRRSAMPGPAPAYRPTFTPDELAACERLLRRPTAPHAQVERARLALLLHAHPALDSAAAARRLGKHVNWVFRWRRAWATEGFRLTDKPGRGRKPALSPPGGGHGQGAGLRAARAAG